MLLITATNIKDDNAGEITPIKRFPGLFPDFSLIFGLLHHLKRRGEGVLPSATVLPQQLVRDLGAPESLRCLRSQQLVEKLGWEKSGRA